VINSILFTLERGEGRCVITVIFGATVGAALCFLIARYFARESITASLSENEKFQT